MTFTRLAPCVAATVTALWSTPIGAAGLAMSIATQQSKAPVKIVAATNTLSAPYETVRVRNESGRPISTVTFAVLVSDPAHAQSKPDYIEGATIKAATIAANEVKELPGQVLSMSDAQKLLRHRPAGAVMQLGVVAVEYADGTRWTYNAKGLRRF